MNAWLLLIPVLSTFGGWLISRIAIGMLLYPVQPKKIAGITIQGIFPKRRAEMTEVMVEIIIEKLFSQKEIEQKIINEHQFENLLPQIEHHIDDFLRHRLGKKMPMIGMFIGETTIRQLKDVFMEELKEIFPSIMSSYIKGLQQQLDFRTDMVRRMNSVPVTKLKTVITRTLSRDLHVTGFVGSILGLLIGIIQVLIIMSIT